MKKNISILALLVMLVFATPLSANTGTGKKFLIEKYSKQLETSTNARDSVRILYNLFDLSDRANQKTYGWQIYETAGRAADLNSQMDMLRQLSVFYQRNDSIVEVLMGLADKIPNKDARAATKAFMFNQHINTKNVNPDDKAFEMVLLDSILNSRKNYVDDKYNQITLLYQIIQYLGLESDGALFKEVLRKYSEVIDELPSSDYPLKNPLYTTGAMIYSRLNENGEQAIEYDRKLLDIVGLLQQMYKKKNRKFRSYDINKFISYRRMLSNYRALSRQEVEEIYDSIMVLYENDPDVKETMDNNNQVYSYYYMATQDYPKAIPAIKKALQGKGLTIYQRRKYYYMLSEAAKAMGDKETNYEAMDNYISVSRVIDSLRKVSIDREILIRDSFANSPVFKDVYSQNNINEATTDKSNSVALTIVASILAILLIIYIVLYFRLRMKR